MNLYVMRHGTTFRNERGYVQGRTHGKLSPQGVAETEAAAKKLAEEKIDLIYSSPMFRTLQTAKIMNKYHNVKIIKHPLITELDQGIFTGRKKSSFSPEEELLRKDAKERGIDRGHGIESYQSVYNRCIDFLDFLQKKHPDKNILVVTHNVSASYLSHILSGRKVDYHSAAQTYEFKNAEIRKFKI